MDDDDLELDFGDDCDKPKKLFSMKGSTAATLKCYPGMKPDLPNMQQSKKASFDEMVKRNNNPTPSLLSQMNKKRKIV